MQENLLYLCHIILFPDTPKKFLLIISLKKYQSINHNRLKFHTSLNINHFLPDHNVLMLNSINFSFHKSQALLQKHMMYHDETKRIHFCPLCPDRPGYFTGVALRRHQKSHHIGLKEYQCDSACCDASFTTSNLLKQHIIQEHGGSAN